MAIAPSMPSMLKLKLRTRDDSRCQLVKGVGADSQGLFILAAGSLQTFELRR